ncbi:MAG: cobalt ECF transporter T component CbiQ, partial [Desulfobulbaceae bacterium]|nr:cobalt ECF transporter T component CbiQ [Desulfobulbaceae bacterium]
MIEELSNGDSFIKRLDPRIKIVVVFLFSVVVAVSNQLPVLMLALALSLLIVLSAGVPTKEFLRRLIPVN